MKKIVIIIGALRKGSFSRKLVKERSMASVISSEASSCHFERSPKGGVEKSDYRQGKAGKSIAQD